MQVATAISYLLLYQTSEVQSRAQNTGNEVKL
jgi:hypothetical protein